MKTTTHSQPAPHTTDADCLVSSLGAETGGAQAPPPLDDEDDFKIYAKMEDDWVHVRIHKSEVIPLRVALKPCPCKAPKSNSTAAIRMRLHGALSFALFPKRK